MSDRRTRPFRFSVQAFEADSGQQWTGVARRAEDLGYSTLFTTDHYFGPGDISNTSGHRPVDVAPLTAMTAAAMATTRLRVGCRVFCVDYHNPVVLAKELATLDMVSDGRLEVGLHFEGAPDENQATFEFFRPRMIEVKASLPRAELEPWDRGWSRLYETFPAPNLDEQVLDGAVERLAGYITTLQPLVDLFLKD